MFHQLLVSYLAFNHINKGYEIGTNCRKDPYVVWSGVHTGLAVSRSMLYRERCWALRNSPRVAPDSYT